MGSLSPEGSLNEEDISVHRQLSIDGDNEDERQVVANTLFEYTSSVMQVGHRLCVMART